MLLSWRPQGANTWIWFCRSWSCAAWVARPSRRYPRSGRGPPICPGAGCSPTGSWPTGGCRCPRPPGHRHHISFRLTAAGGALSSHHNHSVSACFRCKQTEHSLKCLFCVCVRLQNFNSTGVLKEQFTQLSFFSLSLNTAEVERLIKNLKYFRPT